MLHYVETWKLTLSSNLWILSIRNKYSVSRISRSNWTPFEAAAYKIPKLTQLITNWMGWWKEFNKNQIKHITLYKDCRILHNLYLCTNMITGRMWLTWFKYVSVWWVLEILLLRSTRRKGDSTIHMCIRKWFYARYTSS